MGEGRLRVVGIGGTLREGSSSLGALRRALESAEDSGAETELLDLRELNLPMYEPGRVLGEYAPEVREFLEAVRGADALILSTAAYHGTPAGVTKNALDFMQFLSRDERPYLHGRVVGLIATSGGGQGAANANRAMVDAVHALRGVVAPLMVTVPGARRVTDEAGNITDAGHNGRLDQLGALVAGLAGRFSVPVGSAA